MSQLPCFLYLRRKIYNNLYTIGNTTLYKYVLLFFILMFIVKIAFISE